MSLIHSPKGTYEHKKLSNIRLKGKDDFECVISCHFEVILSILTPVFWILKPDQSTQQFLYDLQKQTSFTLLSMNTLSLFDPAFFTWVVSLAVTFNQPNSNASLSQKRYPYHCPTHECCREKPIDCTICSLWTLYHQPSTVFTAHLWETMWCDRFHNAATCRLSPGVDLRLHTLAQLFLDVLKKLQLHYCI